MLKKASSLKKAKKAKSKGRKLKKPRKVLARRALAGKSNKTLVRHEDFPVLPRLKIRVVGIGSGSNAILAEITSQIKKVSFVAANTDSRALKKVKKHCRIFPFGQSLTHQFGTGMDPEMGERAAKLEETKIGKLFKGVDLAVLVVCLGGGTGSGSLPIFAEQARKAKCQVIGIFTLPFKFEGEKKMKIAKEYLKKAEPFLHSFILINNENIFHLVDKQTPLREALSFINKLLAEVLTDLVNIFYSVGFINIDLADLRTILKGREKTGYLYSVTASGKEKAEQVIRKLFQSPLYDYNLFNLRPTRILFNIWGGADLKINEVDKVAKSIWQRNPRAKIIFGLSQRPDFQDKLKITIFALGEIAQEKLVKMPAKKTKTATEIPVKTLEREKAEQVRAEEKRPGGKISKIIQPLRRKEDLGIQAPKQEEKIPGQISVKTALISQKETKKGFTKTSETSLKKEELKRSSREAKKHPRKSAPLRRNALDLKRDIKKIEQEILAQEQKWDIPAFLRKKIKKHYASKVQN